MRMARAGRLREMASPVEGVVLEGDTIGDGANAMVERREDSVASTVERGSFS